MKNKHDKKYYVKINSCVRNKNFTHERLTCKLKKMLRKKNHVEKYNSKLKNVFKNIYVNK